MTNKKIITAPITDSNTQEIKILKILFNNGDFVNKNSIIFEIETSKTVIEITSEHDGYINTSLNVGDIVEINNELAFISDKVIKSSKKSKNNELIISKKAADLISKYKIETKSLNINKKVIKEVDILNYLNKSDEILMTIETYFKKK